nr:pro-opiomelanocortin [Vicugna pacos]
MPRLCRSRSGALLLTLLLQASMEVRGWCLESSQCQDLTTESNLLVRGPWPPSWFGHKMGLGLGLGQHKERGGPYKMQHFRWGSPPKDKRYGGFMTSEKSQTPLVTLFKNAIMKNAHKKGQ